MAKLNGRNPSNFLVAQAPRFVVPASMKVGAVKALEDILVLFGPNGKNWIKGEEHLSFSAGDYNHRARKTMTEAFDGFCLIGGVRKVDGQYEGIAQLALALAIAQYDANAIKRAKQEYDSLEDALLEDDIITGFNDRKSVTFDDIKKVVALAKKLVRTADTK